MTQQKIDWNSLTPEQRRRILERRRLNLELGSYNHSIPPFGYRYIRDKYGYRVIVPDDKIAPVIQAAYLSVAGAEINSAAELAKFLTIRIGKRYYPSAALKLLRDGRNIGHYRLPASMEKKYIKGTNFKETIVTEKLFSDAVKRTLQENW
jgi:hypothetical protein